MVLNRGHAQEAWCGELLPEDWSVEVAQGRLAAVGRLAVLAALGRRVAQTALGRLTALDASCRLTALAALNRGALAPLA